MNIWSFLHCIFPILEVLHDLAEGGCELGTLHMFSSGQCCNFLSFSTLAAFKVKLSHELSGWMLQPSSVSFRLCFYADLFSCCCHWAFGTCLHKTITIHCLGYVSYPYEVASSEVIKYTFFLFFLDLSVFFSNLYFAFLSAASVSIFAIFTFQVSHSRWVYAYWKTVHFHSVHLKCKSCTLKSK